MKMTALRLIGASSVDLPIIGADASGPFVLKGADGLGPPEIVVKLGKTVLEKAVDQGKSANTRQIIMAVGLQPNWDVGQTPEELRTILYGLLTPKYGQMVRCEIVNDGVVQAFAQGHISKMEPAIFAKETTVVITLECDYSYLLNPNTFQVEPEQADVGGVRAFSIENEGTAPSGFLLGLILRAYVGTTLTLNDADPRGQKIQIVGINWAAGDRFVVDTRPGSRGVWRGAGGGALTSVLSNLDVSVSSWIYLYHGLNEFRINTTAFDWDPDYKVVHQPAYWGV